MRAGRGGLLVCLAAGAGNAAAGQSISLSAAHWFTDPGVSDYRLSISGYRFGPVALLPFAQMAVQGSSSSGSLLTGLGGDATIRLNHAAQPYLVAGVSGGFLDFRRNLGLSLWSGWSAGLGAELVRVLGIGGSIEARYQSLSRKGAGGVTLGLRLGTPLGRPRDPPAGREPERTSPLPAESPGGAGPPPLATAGAVSAAASTVVNAALDAMGTPYRWGGSDANGFDCSGLVQYAYGRSGITLPRRSGDQAREGRPVGTSLALLEPGDILVFARDPGGPVSHVGMYLGGGRFVHSATGGTQVSRLTADDPIGRWWLDRWLDSRRILDQEH